MKNNYLTFIGSSVLATGVTLSSFAANANAFTFTNLNEQAGLPASDLYSVGITTSDIGESFDVNWTVDDPILSADATFTVNSFDSNNLILDITLNNTTNLADSDLDNANILSLGFGVDPNATATFSQNGQGQVFNMVSDGQGGQQQFPGGFKNIDVCIFSAGCTGGDVNTGLQAGDTDTFQINIESDTSGGFGSGATLAFFPLKFQTSQGSFEPAGVPEDPNTPPPEPQDPVDVPEPATLLGLGLFTLTAAKFTRKKK